MNRRLLVAVVTGALGATGLLHAQDPPPLTPSDYDRWETLGAATMSPEGRWIAYQIRRVNEQHELRIHRLDPDTVRTVPFGVAPAFSNDGRWIAYAIDVSPEERERLQEADEPVRRQMGLLDLQSGEVVVLDDVASFSFSEDGGFVAIRGYTSGEDAADLTVRDLSTGIMSNFGNVSEFAWASEGPWLAMAIRTTTKRGNGIHLYNPSSGHLRVLHSGSSTYRGLTWREDADDLVVLASQADEAFEDDTHRLLAWWGVGSDGTRMGEFDPETHGSMPPGQRIAEHRRPSWSEDGTKIYVGVQDRHPIEPETDSTEADADPDASAVQIWHAKDERIIPMQRAQERRDAQRTLAAVWHVDPDRFVVLGTDPMESVEILPGDRYAVETWRHPYLFDGMFGRRYQDLQLIDVETGARHTVAERVRHYQGGSATGRYLLYFKGNDYWTYDVTSGETRNLTADANGRFTNTEYDYPVEQYPPWGVAGWTSDDASVLVYDKYDVWRLDPTRSELARLTQGAEDEMRYRLIRLDRDEDAIDPSQPLYLSMTGEWTKQSGYARLRPGREVEPLRTEPRRLRSLQRAQEADVFLYAAESFDDSPDYFVAGPTLDDAERVTQTNAFQSEFAWGRSELIDFQNTRGQRLQGALLYPAGYERGREYPMIVYTYEILSPRVHSYVVPSERSYYNFTVFTQQGYFVLLPDIVYTGRDPGRSALSAVEPAVRAVLDRGLVDPARVGLVGHSWGGYQATYLPTQTDIFAAAVAGAPLTNFLSMMGAIHWNPGLPETGHWETGQARMEVPFWEDFDAHVRNSPAAFVHQLRTPMLMMFGDADGVVDWRQGVEFYNYARRAGNDQFVLLVYPDEDHGLRTKTNQIDYHRRILAWFAHYLKGEPAEAWITDGVPHLERKQTLDRVSGGRDE